MARIKVLDEQTANKIAAGEVVTRPASVVKELVENSIDAGSSLIDIEIKGGGINLIRVTDNGCGMDREDAVLAFERHATSKITSSEDLFCLKTLGFRGEALPSIAAVSKVEIATACTENISGTSIFIEGGRILEIKEVGCPTGTTIIVKDLFYNTPARLKHLKSPSTEAGHISDIISKLALAYPGISFSLKQDGRTVLRFPGKGGILEAFGSLYGPETARDLLPLNLENEFFKIKGYITKPSQSRSSRSHQSFYINGRYIKSKVISSALEQGYHTLLMAGRHPMAILNIETDPGTVDVNIHPTKMEVRFSHENELTELIVRGVRNTLLTNRIIPSIKREPATKPEAGSYKQEQIPLIIKEKAEQIEDDNREAEIIINIGNNINTESNIVNENIDSDEININYEEKTDKNLFKLPILVPLGQIEATYIIAAGEDGLYLVDQHAAHERILYEKFINKTDRTEVSQELLIPITIELTHRESQIMVDNILELAKIGFIIEHFGKNTFLIRNVPYILGEEDGKRLFYDLIEYFKDEKGTVNLSKLKEKAYIMMACKAAIKANHRLSLREMEELLKNLSKTENPFSCPHGRPTIIHFSCHDLEKLFKRVL